MRALPASFYERSAEEVARGLLGMVVVSTVDDTIVSGRIVETEAYTGPEDEASHASARIGRTARNAMMFGPAGLAYVYRIYGIHWCLNAVTDEPGHPAAVLIRAAALLEGREVARRRRGGVADQQLMRGPGNLCKALGLTAALNGHALQAEPLKIVEASEVPIEQVESGPRIGITRAMDLPLRFWIRGAPAVSRMR